MGEGVIVDDGGSTRIKWMYLDSSEKIQGKLEELMTIVGAGSAGRSTHVIKEPEPYKTVRITCQNRVGHAVEREFGFSQDGTKVRICSNLQQNVEVENTPSGLIISLYGEKVGPIVDAKQQNMRRRYVVTNSGPIEKVLRVIDDKEEELYCSADVLPPNERPVIYTSVVFT